MNIFYMMKEGNNNHDGEDQKDNIKKIIDTRMIQDIGEIGDFS